MGTLKTTDPYRQNTGQTFHDGSLKRAPHQESARRRLQDPGWCQIAITGQSVPIFIQVVWSFLISARILMRRLDSLRSRLRALPFGSERRNISMTC